MRGTAARAALMPRGSLALENAARRQQLAVCLQTNRRDGLFGEYAPPAVPPRKDLDVEMHLEYFYSRR